MPVIEIIIGDARWRKIPRLRARLEKTAAATLAHLPKSLRFPCTMTVLLTGDATLRQLNWNFRGVDRPTNVLSFPHIEPRQLSKMGKKRVRIYVGDIALGYQYIVVEAKKEHKMLINHTTHLLIHGILHLFGYDHELGAEAARMERMESRIMVGLGLPDPHAPQPREPKAR